MSLRHTTQGRAPSVEGAAGGERGDTLLEVMISMLVMGSVVVALLGTMLAVVQATTLNRRTVRSSIAVVDVAERNIELAGYHGCGPGAPTSVALLAQYRADVSIDVPGYQVDLVDVRVATTRSGTSSQQPVDFGPCAGTDNGLQEIVVRVTSPAAPPVSHKLVFYKRDVSCPNGYTPLFPGQPC